MTVLFAVLLVSMIVGGSLWIDWMIQRSDSSMKPAIVIFIVVAGTMLVLLVAASYNTSSRLSVSQSTFFQITLTAT